MTLIEELSLTTQSQILAIFQELDKTLNKSNYLVDYQLVRGLINKQLEPIEA